MKINWHKIVLYISLLFLLLALYRANYLTIPTFNSYSKLILSFILLFLGFVLSSNNWKDILEHSFNKKIQYKDAIVSNGLSIFTKYIPGKVMVILGRALFISNKYNISLKTTSLASLQTQVLMLWLGFLISFFLFFYIDLNIAYKLSAIVFLLMFSLFLFYDRVNKLISKLVFKISKKEINIPVIGFNKLFKILPSFILNWTCWSVGFYLFTGSIYQGSLNPMIILSFPLAATFAIIAIIAPGGLGVREGILTFSLIALGLDKTSAITIATASRLWFLLGECFIFVLSLILNKKKHEK